MTGIWIILAFVTGVAAGLMFCAAVMLAMAVSKADEQHAAMERRES